MKWYNTLTPYKICEHNGIDYGVCRDFDHISRYRGLRQLVHNPQQTYRFVALETPNPIKAENLDVEYYEVHPTEENRLDLIAYKKLGNPNYGWVIAYLNNIYDGYTVMEGQKLKIPRSITQLFAKGQILQSVSPITLNLGSE